MSKEKRKRTGQRITQIVIWLLCVAMQGAMIAVALTGMLARKADTVDLFQAIDYVVGVLLNFSISSILNCLFAVSYLICLLSMVKDLFASIRCTAAIFTSKNMAASKNETARVRKNFCHAIFCFCLLFVLSSFCGSTKLCWQGQGILLAGSIVFIITYVLQYVLEATSLSREQILFDIVRIGMLCLLTYEIIVRSIKPVVESFVLGIVQWSNIIASSTNMEAWQGWRLFYSAICEHVLAAIVIISSIALLHMVIADSCDISTVSSREKKIKACFVSIIKKASVWAVIKCIVNTYFVDKEKIPEMSWQLISKEWFGLVRTDILPIIAFALVGLLLYSVSLVMEPTEKK